MTEPQCAPNFKPDNTGTCPCSHASCARTGPLRKKPWVDGRHVKGCPCNRCIGGRVKARARRREHKVAKAVGGKRNIGSGAFGGYDTVGGVCDVEETANVAIVRGLKRWWLSAQVQTKCGRLLQYRLRPRTFVASWDGKPQLAVMPFDDYAELCQLAVGQREAS